MLKEIIKRGDNLFSARAPLMAHWQDVAEQFCPELADFTATSYIGKDFAANLMNSAPLLASRDLTNLLGAMLHPAQEWFFMRTTRDDRIDHAGKQWLEAKTQVQRRATYDPDAKFRRATSEGNRFYSNFGNCVISVERNHKTNKLLFRSWHLRDAVWCEDETGAVSTVYRRWKPTVRDIYEIFKGNISPKLKETLLKDPYHKVSCVHCVMPSDQYKGGHDDKGNPWRFPYISVYYDADNEFVMEEVGSWTLKYVVPRWLTVSGSQYAHSPAVIAALPDARLLQSVTLTLLEAGQKAVDPPMVMPADKLRGDLQLFSGGITVYDDEYDERTGDFLRPIAVDKSGLSYGITLQERTEQRLKLSFFLDKIGLAPTDPRMTAFQTAQVVQDNIRNMLPLLAPTEEEYNGALCNMVFDELWHGGAFGAIEDIPESLVGADIRFTFESPLHREIEKEKGQKFLMAKQLIAEAVPLDQGAAAMFKTRDALRDALEGTGTPMKWIMGKEEMEDLEKKMAEQQAQQNLMAQLNQGAETAKNMGEAVQSFQAIQQGVS